ncbi:hypothetical protein MRY87_12105, partial [bacterium]|nr:hypothetical protein [bacterium]
MTTFDTVTRREEQALQEQARGNGPQNFVDLPVEGRSSDRQDDRLANRLAASEELRGLDTLFAPASLSDSLSQRLNE